MMKTVHNLERKFSVAPMMDWTDRHCRYFHRLLSLRALLFTEMVTSAAVVFGDQDRLLGYNDQEHPIAVQLGGSDPVQLAAAAKICDSFGYDEVNLNVGCPSDRVQSGRFGACLMAEPDLVARCVSAMKDVTDMRVTVKCRIGIDDQDTEEDLNKFADSMQGAGVDILYVHARKAWLKGLSPKENRDIPPLDYGRVYRLVDRLSPMPVVINGGIETLAQCVEHLHHTSGVMLGRAAYKNPMVLANVDQEIFGLSTAPQTLEVLMASMADYVEIQCGKDVRVNQITRHMLGLANGLPGARQFRQIMSSGACAKGAGPEILVQAMAALHKHHAAPHEAESA